MMMRIGMVAAVAAGTLAGAGDARGELVTFLFTAEDAAGRVATGGWTHDAGGGLQVIFPNPPGIPGGAGDVRSTPLLTFASVDGIELFIMPSPAGPFIETVMANDALVGSPPMPPVDYFGIVIFGQSAPGGPNVSFDLFLRDDDATAFDSLRLPGELDLGDFEARTVSFSVREIVSFTGQITSITRAPVWVVPEPATLALCGPAALLGLAGWRWSRKRKVA